jgi:hypothetical protein
VTPAEELRAAATKLREMAAKVPPGPWATDRFWWKTRSEAIPDQWMHSVLGGHGDVAMTSEVHDTPDSTTAADRVAWIALMGPDKAEPLAAWLDAAAFTADLWNTSTDALDSETRKACVFARSILHTEGDGS